MLSRLRPLTLWIETSIVGLFFIQALRFLIGSLYSRIASASLVSSYPPESLNSELPGFVDPTLLSNEIIVLGIALALPLLAILLGRFRVLLVVAAAMTAGGRILMLLPDTPLSATMAAALTIGAGLLYITLLIHNRANFVPHFFILGLALDQLLRAYGNTLDTTLFQRFAETPFLVVGSMGVISHINAVIGLAVFAVGMSLVAFLLSERANKDQSDPTTRVDTNRGLMTVWGGLGLGALLFLQLALLSMPNAIAGRTNADYTTFVPLTIAATLLPLLPVVRRSARRFILPFDSGTRGWIWLVIVALLLVIGTRVTRLPGLPTFAFGATVLIVSQVAISLLWWWFVRPRAANERNMAGLWLVLAMLIFGLLVVSDIFTYEYAFVRDFFIAGNPALSDALNVTITPLLRGFRGLGLGLILLAAFLSSLPMTQSTRRVPWQGGSLLSNVAALIMIAVGVSGATIASAPPRVQPVVDVDQVRIGTYNIHAGYSEFFDYNMNGIAQAVRQSGASIVLLQEVEAGRLTSFGVDQTLWLARELGMDRRFFPTNEGLRGLAVLSRVPIVFDDGLLLPSIDEQTGLQRVQVQPGLPEEGAITVYNTSLGVLLAGETLDDQERSQRQQLNRILEIIATHIENDYGGQLGRALLGGTFHNVPSSPLLQELQRTGFVDPFAGQNIELAATLRRENLPPVRFDYLWLWSQSLQSTGVVVIDNDASDHRLAVAEVLIRSR